MHPYIDIHTHVLPGLDDGVADLAETLECFLELKKLGFGALFCTPHQKEGTLNPPKESMDAVFAAVEEEVGDKLRLFLSAENFYDPQFFMRVQEKTVPTMGGTEYFLFEVPPYNKVPNFDAFVFQLSLSPYRPVLAHIERYEWLDAKKLEPLHDNMEFQINITSFVSAISTSERFKKVNRYMEKGLVDYLATDLHSKSIIPRIEEGMTFIDKTYGRKTLEKLLTRNPRKILKAARAKRSDG